MRRYRNFILLIAIATLTFSAMPALADEGIVEAKLSQEYLDWLEARKNGEVQNGGHIPFPADLSHLADNPPDESLLYPGGRNKAGTPPSKYDLRSVNGKSYVTPIKNQNPYGTCWAHAAIGAMESNFLMQGGTELDLSEMHLAWFTYINADKSKAFDNITWNNKASDQASAPRNYGSESKTQILNEGGNSFYPAALYGRLDGPVLESALAYPNTPAYNKPESYTRMLRLREVYYLAFTAGDVNVNENDTQRTIVKNRVMENGAVVVNYNDQDSGYNSTRTAYFLTKNKGTNHAVQIVGWDDTYSRSNFKNNPGMDGAWLIKNSWGTSHGDNGYMWISYANYLNEGAAFIVELANPDLKAYYYDPLGWTGASVGWGSSSVYIANAFKAERDNEKVTEVGFYTSANNQKYEISVYTGLGTSMPSSPVAGTPASTMSGTIPFAGYHTVTLTTPVTLTKNQYFSVVLKYEGLTQVPLASKVPGMSDNFVLQEGSFFSSDGSSWTKGSTLKANAPLKAFTVTTGASGSKPTIVTSSLPQAVLNTSYTAVLTAFGETPITWSKTSGTLPDGIILSSSGILSGTATKSGDYSFTVQASNKNGDVTQAVTLSVVDLPAITTTEFTGYATYNLTDAVLALSYNTSAKWSAPNLPKGLKLNEDTGEITGKLSQAGTYTFQVNAVTSAGTSSENVTLTINAKPEKIAIKTSNLGKIEIGSAVDQKLQITGTEPITLTVDGLPAGLEFNYNTYVFSGTPTVAGKFNIVVSATNIVCDLTNGKPITKKLSLEVKGKAPKISTPISLPNGEVNKEYPGYTFTISEGTAPEKWTASGLPKGLTLNAKTGELSGTPTKDGAFTVKVTAQNNGGKDTTDKLTLLVLAKPEITIKNKLKDGTTDKAYSLKLTAKGSPTYWKLTGLPDTLTKSVDKKGDTLIIGTPTEAKTYSVTIVASNDVGSDTVTLPLTIKGVAPKITSKLTNGALNTEYSGTIIVEGTKPFTSITYTIADKDKEKFGISSLEELGLTFTANTSTGVVTIAGTPKYSVKGLPVQVAAVNSVKTVTKKVTLKVAGTRLAFTKPTDSTVKLSGSAGSSVKVDFEVTGSEKITWSVKPTTFTLTANGNTATLTGTVPAKKTTVTVTVENSENKLTKKVEITPSAATSAKNGDALDYAEDYDAEDYEVPEDSLENSLPEITEDINSDESTITFGEPRNDSESLNSQRAVLEEEGYEVAAVLPEIKATVSGMYDLEITLDETVDAGKELLWFAFPKNAEETDDDEIAEFYDDEGEEINEVPESRKITVSVWLNEGVIYEPVIGVR